MILRHSVLFLFFYLLNRYFGHDFVKAVVWALIATLALMLFDVLFYRFYFRPRILNRDDQARSNKRED